MKLPIYDNPGSQTQEYVLCGSFIESSKQANKSVVTEIRIVVAYGKEDWWEGDMKELSEILKWGGTYMVVYIYQDSSDGTLKICTGYTCYFNGDTTEKNIFRENEWIIFISMAS